MRLTPGQIAELKSASNCYGLDPVHGPLYLVRVKPTTLKRLQELANLKEPRGVLWVLLDRDTARGSEVVYTTHPEILMDLEGMIDDAARPR